MQGHSKIRNLLALGILPVLFAGGCQYFSTPPHNSNNPTANNSTVNNPPAPDRETIIPNANAPQPSKKEVLFDFRTEESFPKQQKIASAEADAILKYVFHGAGYRTTAKDASVDQRFSGAFSQPNAQETLYFVRGGTVQEQETLSRGEINLLGYLVIYDKTTPVAKIKVAAYGVHKITDLNRDGKNELLLANGGYGQGISENGLKLVQIVNGATQTVKDFGLLQEDACAAGLPNVTGVTASVITYQPVPAAGDFPQFELAYYKRGCGKNAAWEQLSKSPFSE